MLNIMFVCLVILHVSCCMTSRHACFNLLYVPASHDFVPDTVVSVCSDVGRVLKKFQAPHTAF
jgi:hypothetical protein